MTTTSKRRKYFVEKLNIQKKHTTFDIKLPKNVKQVTGVYIQIYLHPDTERVGTISFQSHTASDVFLCTEVYGDNAIRSDDSYLQVFQGDFDIDDQYVSGKIPKKIPLWIEGDTGLINGWFKASHTAFPYPIHIIVEYEEVEKIVAQTQNERVTDH